MKNKIVGLLIVLICFFSFQTTKAATDFKVGDYVKMTPSKSSYTISKDKTGYSNDQTINPSELNLWRVIKVNGDGTIDMVSQNTSNSPVIFYGKKGWQNLVGVLNTIAKQYENTEYTKDARYIGYSGQQDFITGIPTNGEGGTLKEDDLNIMEDLGIKILSKNYWLAFRYFQRPASGENFYSGQSIGKNGFSIEIMYEKNANSEKEVSSFLRPIIILKSNITASGIGTKDNPYILGNDNSNVDNNDQSNLDIKDQNDNSNDVNKNQEIINENPPTGKFVPAIIIGFGIISAFVIYFIVKKKNKIYKI